MSTIVDGVSVYLRRISAGFRRAPTPVPPPFATLRDTFQTQGGVGSVRPDSAGLRASHSFCCPLPTQARNSG